MFCIRSSPYAVRTGSPLDKSSYKTPIFKGLPVLGYILRKMSLKLKMNNLPFSIAILAGGQSRRMGQNKALIKLGGVSVLQRVIDVAQPLSEDVILVTNTPHIYQQFHLPMVADIVPNKAALGGVYTALSHTRHPWTLVLACDMPFLNSDVITHMARHRRSNLDVVCPRIDDHPEPLHTFYKQTCIPTIEDQIATDQLKITMIFKQVQTLYLGKTAFEAVTLDPTFLLNMNTPQDLAKAMKKCP